MVGNRTQLPEPNLPYYDANAGSNSIIVAFARGDRSMESEYTISFDAINVLVLSMLALDLVVFHRKAHVVSLREAAAWSVVWICFALIFNLWL
jgi:hypothetical protein